MATSKTRELEDYFERIVRKREGDLPGRRKGDEHLSQTHALYHAILRPGSDAKDIRQEHDGAS